MLEYVPLIRRAGGVRLFAPEISYQWFLPRDGLLGDLYPKEIRYLALLIRHAKRVGRLPVFGFTRSLGRIAAIKKLFSGLHIFQYRSLWTQWLSWIDLKKNGNDYFFRQFLRIMIEVNDAYLSKMLGRHLSRCVSLPSYDIHEIRKANHYDCCQIISKVLLASSDHQLFTLYFGFHTYFYMFARKNADIMVDTTRAVKDKFYRNWVCRQLTSATGLPIKLDDISELQRYHPFEPALIDWEEIKQNLDLAVLTLSQLFDKDELSWYAAELVDETLAEIETSERYLATARREINRLTSERDALRDERDRLSELYRMEMDRLAGELSTRNNNDKSGPKHPVRD